MPIKPKEKTKMIKALKAAGAEQIKSATPMAGWYIDDGTKTGSGPHGKRLIGLTIPVAYETMLKIKGDQYRIK